MIHEWRKTEYEMARTRAVMHAMAANGTEIPDFEPLGEVEVNPFYL